MHPALIPAYNKWLISVQHKEHFTCKICDYPIIAEYPKLHWINEHEKRKEDKIGILQSSKYVSWETWKNTGFTSLKKLTL